MELQILIDASNGASDYGNKFGEPLIQVLYQLFEGNMLFVIETLKTAY